MNIAGMRERERETFKTGNTWERPFNDFIFEIYTRRSDHVSVKFDTAHLYQRKRGRWKRKRDYYEWTIQGVEEEVCPISRPIRGQYQDHMITLDQSEAR